MTICARCGEQIEYVFNRTRGYWAGRSSCADGSPFNHTPPPEYYRRPKEAPNA